MKVKTFAFERYHRIETVFNDWTKENPNFEIVNVKVVPRTEIDSHWYLIVFYNEVKTLPHLERFAKYADPFAGTNIC